MRRTDLEKYLGKEVELKICGDEMMQGVSHKTGEDEFKHDPNLLLPQNMYFLMPERKYLFRSSHVKGLKEINKGAN